MKFRKPVRVALPRCVAGQADRRTVSSEPKPIVIGKRRKRLNLSALAISGYTARTD